MAGRNLRGQDVRRGRITPAANRGRNLNIPSVRYAAPIEEPEEIEMGLVGLARFDGAPRQGRRVHIEEDVDIQQVSDGENEAEEVSADGPRDWTIVQAWTVLGYGTLTLPSYISCDGDSSEYVLKSNFIQKVLCFVQHGFATADTAMRFSEIPYLVSNNPTPYTFIQIAGIFASMASSLWFFKVAFRNHNNILAYHNAAETMKESRCTRTRKSNGTGIFAFIASASFILFVVGIKTIILLNDYDNEWTDAAGPAAVQGFACYAKRVYMWRDYNTCGSEIFATKFSSLSFSEIFYGILGLVTFINAKVATSRITIS